MAIQRKLSTALQRQPDQVTISDGVTTTVQTWVGSYAQCLALQTSTGSACKSSALTQDGPNGRLTLTFETQPAGNYQFQGGETNTEVVWTELRKPIGENPYFDSLTTNQRERIQAAVAGDAAAQTEVAGMDTIARELYDYLIKGVTEYAIGVPVVRRTKTRKSGNQGGGRAWVRDSPPVSVPGDWEWMKTADERRKDGKTFTLVEEWTGATKWDENLYPT